MSNEPYNYSELLGRIKAKKLTQEELARIIKLNPSTLNLKLNNKSEFSQSDLRNFKLENPRIVKFIKRLNIITREGFIKFCRAYGIQIETPKIFRFIYTEAMKGTVISLSYKGEKTDL